MVIVSLKIQRKIIWRLREGFVVEDVFFFWSFSLFWQFFIVRVINDVNFKVINVIIIIQFLVLVLVDIVWFVVKMLMKINRFEIMCMKSRNVIFFFELFCIGFNVVGKIG